MDSANPATGPQAHATVPSAPAEVWPATSALPAAPVAAPSRPPRDRVWFRRTGLKLLRAPFTRDTARQIEYALLGLLLAILGFVFIAVTVTVGLGMSLSFAGMLLGLPLLVVALLGARRLGAVNRSLAGRLLGVQVEPPSPLRRRPGALGLVRAVLADPVGWRACAYLLLKLLLSVLSVIIVIYLVAWGIPYLMEMGVGYPRRAGTPPGEAGQRQRDR
jgi:hypothetical protein